MTSEKTLRLKLLDHDFGIVKLEPDRPVPEWAAKSGLWSVTRTESELTIVCPEKEIPADFQYEGVWRCIQVEETFDFEATGVIAALAGALARNRISIYVISSYVTDYFLVKKRNIQHAVRVLEEQGHVFAG